MDGYAVRATDTKAANARLRLTGTSAAGAGFGGRVEPGCAVRIFTGAPMPNGSDAVVIQENVTRATDAIVLAADGAVVAGRHVRRAGLDFRAGDVLLSCGQRLGARELALAAAMNFADVPCARRPRVGILATGDELVAPGTQPGPDQIVSSTPYGLAADITRWGGEPILLGIARDTVDDIRAKLAEAATFDIVVTIGGASVGDFDLVQKALSPELALQFWKIAMRPGKPLIHGTYFGARLLGLPGNPVSAFVCAQLFLKPLIFGLIGATEPVWTFVEARLASDLGINDTRQEYARARLERSADGSWVVRPLPVQDSSMLRFLATADGLVVRPPHDPARTVGDLVSVLTL
jgi:molybdopterin molybdotransferase